MSNDKTVRIGCASAFWGDTSTAAEQLVRGGKLDYLVFDYLAEVTMSIMAGQKLRDPEAGYAKDFVATLAPLLADIKSQGIKVVSNAGGINPSACRDALAAAARTAGLELKIAAVIGDDLMPRVDEFQNKDITEWETGKPLPKKLVSMNAYIGAAPVAQALDNDADIVITGRCVDSAVVVGPLVQEFGWQWSDYDLLSQASLAGHIIECGAQCTGGNYTDWEQVSGFENMGFPVVEVSADGSFVVSKPDNTGGLVNFSTVAEQMVYEIGDPRQYFLPDVICDFTQVIIDDLGNDQVKVSGAKGLPPTTTYKVSATHITGFRCTATVMLGGPKAAQKAQLVGESIIKKCQLYFAEKELGDFIATDIETIGAESTYGPHAKTADTREVMLKLAVKHANKDALKFFSREIAQAATGMTPGLTGYFGGRPTVSPVIQLFTCLVDKADVPMRLDISRQLHACTIDKTGGFNANKIAINIDVPPPVANGETVTVRLIDLAWARSGDKGDHANIGVIARKAEYLPWIRQALTNATVKDYFAHLCEGEADSWVLPGINAINFLLKNSLGGGGIASLRTDPQGKAFAQMLLDYPVDVPASLLS